MFSFATLTQNLHVLTRSTVNLFEKKIVNEILISLITLKGYHGVWAIIDKTKEFYGLNWFDFFF